MGVEWGGSKNSIKSTIACRVVIAAGAAALAVLAWCGEPDVADTKTSPDIMPPAGATCQEDEPCWDCETMGNQICGPLPSIPRTG